MYLILNKDINDVFQTQTDIWFESTQMGIIDIIVWCDGDVTTDGLQ